MEEQSYDCFWEGEEEEACGERPKPRAACRASRSRLASAEPLREERERGFYPVWGGGGAFLIDTVQSSISTSFLCLFSNRLTRKIIFIFQKPDGY